MDNFGDAVVIGAAIFAHAWVQRIVAPPEVVNVSGWVVAILFMILLCSRFVHCG